MNRAKKTQANPVELLEVKLLLRGFASELPPEPEPEHTALPPAPLTLEDMPEQLAMVLRLRRVSKASLTQMKQILKKCKQASKACVGRGRTRTAVSHHGLGALHGSHRGHTW